MTHKVTTTSARVRSIPRLAFVLVLWGLTPSFAPGQNPPAKIRVAVVFDDGDAGTLVGGLFKAALRNLGDIEIVDKNDSPVYVISGPIMCSPREDCRTTSAFVAALRLYSTMAQPDLKRAMRFAGLRSADTAVARLYELLRHYEQTYGTWTVSWPRAVYEQASREFVAELDAKCFEKRRLLTQMQPLSGEEYDKAYSERISSKQWIC